MGNIQPQFFKSHLGGMITNVSESLAPKDSVQLMLNCDGDEELGSAVTRLGTGLVGSTVTNPILGLHDFRDSDGSNHALLATVNASGGATSVVYKVGTGTIRTGLTASKKMRFITFLDSAFMVNGANDEASYDGNSLITTGGAFDLDNVPGTACNLVMEWLDRVYLAGDTSLPDRVYYSSTPVDGAISWTSGNGFFDLEPEDGGGGITGFGKVPGFLLIFKERSLKRFNFDSAFPETLIQLGTPSQESVVNAGGLCAFYSASSEQAKGFYITNGDRPIPISHDRPRNIKKWIDAIPQSAEANIAGIGNGRVFMWSVGDLTVDGRTFTNVVLRWNRILDQWSVRSYPSEFKFFSTYVSSGTNTIIGGDDVGNVIQIDKAGTYTDYNAKPIHWEVQYHDEDFGYNQEKEISDCIYINSKNMDGAKLSIGTHTFPQTIKGRISEIKITDPIEDNVFQIAVKGTVEGARGVLKQVEFPNVNVNQTYVS